jgi:uncharacterized protein (TIGR02598 family)
MISLPPVRKCFGFSLVEVVLALGIVSFSVLATIGLLSVANDTNKRSREEAFAAQLAANEFERIRAMNAFNFPTAAYSRFYDAGLAEVPQALAVYELQITPSATGTGGAAERVMNAEVRYPVGAQLANQNKVLFTTLMNLPPP